MATDYTRTANVSKRVRFYDGQFLQDKDFIDEQNYHLDRQARNGRSLQVAGIVEGLVVTAADQPFFVNVAAGTAVDMNGQALVLADSRSELDKDGLAIIRSANEPFELAADTASSEQYLYLAYCQLPTDLQQSQEGLQGETRWHEAPFLFVSTRVLGSDDAYERPPWSDYLATRPTPILLARLAVAADGGITVATVGNYSGLRLPGPNDGASWVVTTDNRIQLRYGQEQASQTPLTVSGGNVGIGTETPTAVLEVKGTSWSHHLKLSNETNGGAGPAIYFNARNRDWAIIGTNSSAGAGESKLGFYDATANAYRMVLDQNGNLGVGADAPGAHRLHVAGGSTQLAGNLNVTGTSQFTGNVTIGQHQTLSFVNQTRQMIHLWEQSYGIGIQNSTQYFRSGKNFAWFKEGAHTDDELNAGGGTAMMVIRDGNVGINTTTPSTRLDVNGNGGSSIDMRVNGRLKSDNNDGGLWIASDRFVGGHGTNKVGFWNGNAWRLTVQANGNIGIGTDSPEAKLEVVANDTTVGGWYEAIRLGQTAHSAITHPGGSLLFGLHGNRHFYFADIKNTNQLKYLMSINADTGNVGIGVDSGSAKLHVKGNLNFDSDQIYVKKNLKILANYGFSPDNQTLLSLNPNYKGDGLRTAVHLYAPNAYYTNKPAITMAGNYGVGAWVGIGNTEPAMALDVTGAGGTNVDFQVNGRMRSNSNDGGLWVSTDRFVGGHTTNHIGIWNGNAWRLSVAPNGNVGVGTTTPQAKLDVIADATTAGGWYEALRFSQGAHSAITHPNGGLLFGLHSNRKFYFADIKDNSFRKYVMTINAESGNVGIGTDNPGQKLVIEGTSASKHAGSALSGGGQLAIKGAAPQIDFIDSEGGHKDWSIHVNSSRMYFIREPWEHTDLVLNGLTGRVGMGTPDPQAKLDVIGDTKVRGNIWMDGNLFRWANGRYLLLNHGSINTLDSRHAFWTSDKQLKKDVKPLTNALEKVRQLQGVLYRWNDAAVALNTEWVQDGVVAAPNSSDEENQRAQAAEKQKIATEMSGQQLGLIAQQVEKVLPALVKTDEKGIKGINYGLLSVFLIEAFKELDAQVAELANQVVGLAKRERKQIQ